MALSGLRLPEGAEDVKMVVRIPAWLERLRQQEVVRPVLDDPRSSGGSRLGVSLREALALIEWGQANFDQGRGNLSPDDLTLLYAFFNQKRHIEELTAVFEHLFQNTQPDDPILVDVGCGPFTGGLAFAGALGADARFDYIGIDRSEAMLRRGRKLASAANSAAESPRIRARWANDLAGVSWTDALGWRPVVVVASYLLASPTLEVERFVPHLNSLLKRLGLGAVTVLVTNSPKQGPNRALPEWRAQLKTIGFEERADFVATIEVERPDGQPTKEFRCALWHRPAPTEYRPEDD